MRTASIAAIAIVLAMVGASFGALLGNVAAVQSGPDSYGYVYTDSKSPWPSVSYTWTEIYGTGTDTGLSGDDDWNGPFPIGFDFNFYGTRYSAFNVTINGYIMFGTGTYDYSNDYIPYTGTPNNIVAAYWDDMYANSGDIVYQTIGAAPYRQLVVEYYTVNRLGYSSYPMTFEIVLNESRGDIWVNYQSMSGMAGSGATEGIENSGGTVGVQYGYNSAVLTDSLSIRYSLPEIMIGPPQTDEGRPGDVISYSVTASNLQLISDTLSISSTSVEGWTVAFYDDLMNPLTDTNGDFVIDTGILATMEAKNLVVEVTIPGTPGSDTEITYVTATSVTDPSRNFTCTLTTEVLAGWFDPPHNDYGNDVDSDGNYDYLIIEATVEVFTAGWFGIEGWLHTSSEASIEYDWAQASLTAGTGYLQLTFRGWDINEYGADGPYHVHMNLYDNSWVLLDQNVHTTSAYLYSDFMPILGEFNPPMGETPVDDDSNGLYDYLQIDVNLMINYAGRFILEADLYDDNWNLVSEITVDTDLSTGANTIALQFDSWPLSDITVIGPYYVYLSLYGIWESSITWLEGYWHTTATYDPAEYEPPPAVFTLEYADWVTDADSDMLHDSLVVEVGVSVTVEGDYLITGSLEDIRVTATNLTHLTVGVQYVQLVFGGWPVYYGSNYYGYSGPYDIYLTIMNGSLLLDEWYTSTSGWWYADFEREPGWFEVPHSDAGVDTDGDTLFNQLLVTVGVNVTVAGWYELRSTLYDDWWSTLEQVDNATYLNAGLNNVTLLFTGARIYNQGNDGVFYVEMYLYDSGNRQLDYESYTTASYLYTDFDDGLLAEFGTTHDADPVNDDADADYERLVAYVAVEVYTDGRYLVDGVLYDAWWNWIGSASVWADLTAGSQVVELSFPGYLVSGFAVSGSFYIEFRLYDVTMYYLDFDDMYTASIDSGTFDDIPPRISSSWAYSAPGIDGLFGAGEWGDATVIDLGAAVPTMGFDAEMRIMNDADYLYILIDALEDRTMGSDDYASIAFDTDNDNTATDGREDQFLIQQSAWDYEEHLVNTGGWWNTHCSPFDHEGLYAKNGFGPTPTLGLDHRIYEIAIPLALLGATQGDVLGFLGRATSYYGIFDDNTGSELEWPMDYGTTPQLGHYVDLELATNFPPAPPVTTATVTGTLGSGSWYKSNVSVTLSATGGDGGVDYTEWRFAGGSWQTYTAAISVTGEGNHTIEFRSVDNGGQVEATKSLTVKIDTVAPVSSDEVSGASVWLNATDDTSAVASVMYRIDGGSWTVYAGVIEFASPGTYLVEFYAVDVAGNQEAMNSVTVVVEEDDIPIFELGLGVGVLVAALLVILLLLIRRKKRQQPADMNMMAQAPPMMMSPPEPPPT